MGKHEDRGLSSNPYMCWIGCRGDLWRNRGGVLERAEYGLQPRPVISGDVWSAR